MAGINLNRAGAVIGDIPQKQGLEQMCGFNMLALFDKSHSFM